MSTDSRMTKSAATKSAASWDLRHPGLHHDGRQRRGDPRVHWACGPSSPMPTSSGLTDAAESRAPYLGRPWKNVLGGDDDARPDPDGALVRRHQHRVRSHPLLRLAVRQQPGEVLRRLRAQREGEPREGLGHSASAVRPARTRRRATSCSTSRAGRSRPWRATTPFRASTWARSRRWPTGTRRRRSSSARSPPATATSRTRSTLSSPSWPSHTNSCASGAAIDTDVGKEQQYTDVPERLGVKRPRRRSAVGRSAIMSTRVRGGV